MKITIQKTFNFSKGQVKLLQFLKDSPDADRGETLSPGEEGLFEKYGEGLFRLGIMNDEYNLSPMGREVVKQIPESEDD